MSALTNANFINALKTPKRAMEDCFMTIHSAICVLAPYFIMKWFILRWYTMKTCMKHHQ